MTIKNWPEGDRPREKLSKYGAKALTNAELLAIFFTTGIAGKCAVTLAREQLQLAGGLRALLDLDETAFCAAKGIGFVKYIKLQAALELGRRYLKEELQQSQVINSSTAMIDYLTLQLRQYTVEIFACLFLNAQLQVIDFVELCQGTVDSAFVHPREVVKMALQYNAVAVILAHNHPSGSAEPSKADRKITQRLQQALNLVDIRVLDHIIIGQSDSLSFADRGWI